MSATETYHGKLADFFETGCEGSYWVLERFDKSGYDELVFLRNGDVLTIYDEAGETVYSDIIKEDRNKNLRQRPLTAAMQPVCRGRWVHWLQSGVDPDLWGEWFLSERFTGVLTRRREQFSSD